MPSRIQALFASFGDPEAFVALLDPAVRLVGVRSERYAELPLYGTFHGHEGARRFLAGLAAAFEPRRFAIDAELEDEDQGFAAGRVEHRVRPTGEILRLHWAVHCHFRQGLLTYYRFYEDTAATEAAFRVQTRAAERPWEE